MIRILTAALALVCFASTARASLTTDALLDTLQHTAFDYFWNEANASNGLIRDRSQSGSPASIASMGFGLSAICIGIDHGWVTRDAGRARILTTLQTLWTQPQSSAASGTIGYKGLYYHFLDMNTATRMVSWDTELSTIDTALLFAGIIDAKQYFATSDTVDVQLRDLADSIYYRANWEFMRNFNPGLLMGWKPGTNFAGFGQWIGYNEAMILYILALGSPTHPIPNLNPNCWNTWTSGYSWQVQYGYQYVIFPPLFGHQYSHCWIDFRHNWDAYMQGKGITYFENSRRATLAQRAYCIANPGHFTGYGANLWGITASDTPSGYSAHGAPPPQNDDGTIAPTATIGSIAFAPGAVIPTLHSMYDTYPQVWGPYGFKDAFNPTVSWIDSDYIGIDQGPIIIMIENYRTQSVWNRFMQNADIQRGLQRAGFTDNLTVDLGPGGSSRVLALRQNSPNPFRDASWVSFKLPADGPVFLALYDAKGRRARTVIDGQRSAGEHVVRLDGHDLPTGVYWYRLEHGGQSVAKRCVLAR